MTSSDIIRVQNHLMGKSSHDWIIDFEEEIFKKNVPGLRH